MAEASYMIVWQANPRVDSALAACSFQLGRESPLLKEQAFARSIAGPVAVGVRGCRRHHHLTGAEVPMNGTRRSSTTSLASVH